MRKLSKIEESRSILKENLALKIFYFQGRVSKTRFQIEYFCSITTLKKALNFHSSGINNQNLTPQTHQKSTSKVLL